MALASGAATQVGLPGESEDIVPPPAQWSDTSLATMAFGQGVSVTPISMARFYCAIANGGILMGSTEFTRMKRMERQMSFGATTRAPSMP